MKIRCDAKQLTQACEMARTVIGRKSATFPNLSYVAVEVNADGIALRATNLERMIIKDISGEILEEGKAMLPVKRVWQFAKKEKGMIELSADPKEITITTEGATLKIAGGDIDADIPIPPYGQPVATLGDEYWHQVERVCHFAALEESRPVLTTVLHDFEEQKLSLCAADGFRLAVQEIPFSPSGITPMIQHLSMQFLIPRETCLFVNRFMRKGNIVLWAYEGKAVCFQTKGLKLISQIAQGKFPTYKMLIPSDPPAWKFTVSGPMLESRMLQFEADSGIARFKSGDKVLQIATKAECEGEFNAEIPALIEGEGQIAFNQKYIALLGHLFAELTGECSIASQPIKVHGDIDGFTVVVMPMFVQW